MKEIFNIFKSNALAAYNMFMIAEDHKENKENRQEELPKTDKTL